MLACRGANRAMMPKVTMKAPPQIDGGQIHASQSGKVYNLDEKGMVTIDSCDMQDLIGIGYTVVESDGSDADQKHLTTSVSLTSATQGAQALDESARQAGQRKDVVIAGEGNSPNGGDHGGAVPPYGKPVAPDNAVTEQDAKAEAETKAAAGGNPSKPSAQAETGHLDHQSAPADAQKQAADEVAKQ